MVHGVFFYLYDDDKESIFSDQRVAVSKRATAGPVECGADLARDELSFVALHEGVNDQGLTRMLVLVVPSSFLIPPLHCDGLQSGIDRRCTERHPNTYYAIIIRHPLANY